MCLPKIDLHRVYSTGYFPATHSSQVHQSGGKHHAINQTMASNHPLSMLAQPKFLALICVLWVSHSTPWRCPAPIPPIGLGLAQIGLLLWVMIDKRKVLRAAMWIGCTLIALQLVGVLGVVIAALLARWRRSAAVCFVLGVVVVMGALQPRNVPTAPPFLPAKWSEAPPAAPLPDSKHPALRQGGKLWSIWRTRRLFKRTTQYAGFGASHSRLLGPQG